MIPQRILFTGTTGECIPPPYGGIPKRALMLGAEWKKSGVKTGYTFLYHHDKEEDLGASGDYFFEYQSKPNKFSKIFFIIRYYFKNPSLYSRLFSIYRKTYKRIDRQSILYPAYGVFLDTVYTAFKPNVVVGEAALIQSFMALQVACMRNIPFVLEPYAEIHDPSMIKSYNFSEKERDLYWTNFLAQVTHIIGSSNYCSCGPRKYAPLEKTTMIFATTLDVNRFDKNISAEEKTSLRDKFNIPQDLFLVMAVGAFTHRKGHDHIIEAISTIKETHSKIGVVLCGAGDPAWLKDLAKERGVSDNVFFFQNVSEEDLTNLYHTVDLYCDASNTPRACLGIALTDALASRLPTLAYDVAGLPESVHDGENGYLVPVNDIRALGKAIAEMADRSPVEREGLGLCGLALARKIFDLPIIAKQILDTLTLVTEKNN
jgi:glycosyltransferase involved in cell wall biosynthesis